MSKKLAVQMYTIRDFTTTASDLEASLKKIAAIGYPAVQMSAVGAMNGESPEVDVATAKKMLDDNGIKCIATHKGWGEIMNETDKVIEFQKALDCPYVAVGAIRRDYPETIEGFRKFIADAKPAVAKLKEAGIQFGYHNHSHEFAREERYGKTLLDIVIEEGGPDIQMELDLYWVDHAGANPVRIVEKCKGRIPVIHLKDKEVDLKDGPRMAAIGEGNLDWDGIIAACEANGVDWYAVEQDQCYRDAFDCLKSSFDFLDGKGL